MTLLMGSYDWHQKIAELYEEAGSESFPALLHEAISSIITINSFIIFRYQTHGIPEILYEFASHQSRKNNLQNYLEGAYLLDPFYQYSREGQTESVVTLKEAAPDHFLKSEYYKTYYKFSGLKDEVNIFVNLKDNSSLALALGRVEGQNNFTRKDKRLLHDLQPILRPVCFKHWKDNSTELVGESNVRFIQGMENFGKSCLSVKEGEVLHLLLRGHSAKSTAQRMGISPGTVKIHRNNIYTKLDINSQTELFSLFIGALAHMTGDGSEDPLIAYHQTTQ